MAEEAHKFSIPFKSSSSRRKRGALGIATDTELHEAISEVVKISQVNSIWSEIRVGVRLGLG